jgi:hypothetical protein
VIDSKSIDDLRPDIAANAHVFVRMMAARGYKVAFASTLRDDEKQAQLYAQGRTSPGQIVTGSKVTTFHGKGLAFDIYQGAATFTGQWLDAGFWKTARELQILIGFSKISGEESHSQWSDRCKYSGSQVRAGILLPPMPLYEEDDMTKDEVLAIIKEYEATKAAEPCPEWAKAELQDAIAAGITDGTKPCVPVPRYQAAIMAKRATAKK